MKKESYNILERNYIDVCNRIVLAFSEKYGHDVSPDDWVAGDVGGIICVGDYFINFDDIRLMMRKDIPFDTFLEWYDYCIDANYVGLSSVNFKSWVQGFRDVDKEELAHLVSMKRDFDKKIREYNENKENNCF